MNNKQDRTSTRTCSFGPAHTSHYGTCEAEGRVSLSSVSLSERMQRRSSRSQADSAPFKAWKDRTGSAVIRVWRSVQTINEHGDMAAPKPSQQRTGLAGGAVMLASFELKSLFILSPFRTWSSSLQTHAGASASPRCESKVGRLHYSTP